MQGKRVIRLGDREYTIEKTHGGDYAIYCAEGTDTPFVPDPALEQASYVGNGVDIEPGTLVVILARVATPPPSIEVERRYYQDRHWEGIDPKAARRRISQTYGKNTEAVWQELVTGTVVGAGECQYRRRES